MNFSEKGINMKAQTKNILSITIRCLLIFLFCYTAVSKWLSYDDLMYQLTRSPFIPAGYTFLSVALPASEIAISLLLAFDATAKAALAASATLLFIFTAYIIGMLLFAPFVPCSCGGFISTLSWHQHIVLNSTLIVLAVIAYICQDRKTNSPFTIHHSPLIKSLLQ